VPRLEICLLGPPRVIAPRQAAPIRRRRALALVAFLAANRTPQTRESLTAMFWPDADRESAHAQLRNHLWVLRRAGLDPWLSTEGEMVELRSDDGLRIDVREHRRLLGAAGLASGRRAALSPRAEPILSEAVAIYQGDFLAGFSLPDSFAFEEWQLREEEALRSGQGVALDALIRLRERLGDMEGALAGARQRMLLDPLNEQSLRTLMTVLRRMGRRSEALAAYERCRRSLEREMEIAPCRETILLRNEILAGSTGAARARPAPAATSRSVLPEPPTPFVGREKELEEIARCFDAPELRLLTLTGPGGCGKTRLALEAARRLSPRFPDGVVFAPLATLEAGRLLPAALAEVLSLWRRTQDRVPSGTDSIASGSHGELIDFLREKRMLLILDNLEQVANDLGSLREILAGARGTVVLATSRSRLNLAGEQVLEVEGLPWPARNASPEEVSRCASVRLFLQAVQRVRSPFRPARTDQIAAGGICRRLRGHPLGIELAASWAHSLGVAEIAEQLAAGLDLEAAPRADVPPRHRSLRRVFEQSWALLSSEERAVFRRLCSLPGSFSREAALEIGGSPPGVFAALIEQSFLRRTRGQRFEILETLRQFGREKLAENIREDASVRDRAARHYLGRLIASRGALEGAGQTKALQDLTLDRLHLRPAWLRAAEHGWSAEMSKAMRPLFLFYDMRSRFVEGAETFGLTLRCLTRRAARRSPQHAASVERLRLAALARVAQAWFMRFEGDDRCRALMRKGQRDLRKSGTPAERAFADALAAILDPASPGAEPALREGAEQCERAGDLWCAGLALEVLAYRLRDRDPEEGFRVLQRSLALRRRGRDRWSIALGLYAMGLSLEHRGLRRGARRRYEESLALRRRLGADPDGILDCLDGIARMALCAGAVEEARRHCAEALILAGQLGIRVKVGLAQTRMAQIHCLAGRPAEARPLLQSALVTAEELANAAWSSHLHALGGIVALDMGEGEEARWSLERAVAALPPRIDPASTASAQKGWLRSWSTAWRDLLDARLAMLREEPAAPGPALVSALRVALADHHEPLVGEILAVWAELYASRGLAAALLACPAFPSHRRSRLEPILRRPDDAPSGSVPVPPGTPTVPSPDVSLLRLAAEVLSEESSGGAAYGVTTILPAPRNSPARNE
jgi:predicted ATPase/DNA-binding SARP family transcriptional activator